MSPIQKISHNQFLGLDFSYSKTTLEYAFFSFCHSSVLKFFLSRKRPFVHDPWNDLERKRGKRSINQSLKKISVPFWARPRYRCLPGKQFFAKYPMHILQNYLVTSDALKFVPDSSKTLLSLVRFLMHQTLLIYLSQK